MLVGWVTTDQRDAPPQNERRHAEELKMPIDQLNLWTNLLTLMFPDGIKPSQYDDLHVVLCDINDFEDMADQIERHQKESLAKIPVPDPLPAKSQDDDKIFAMRAEGKNVREIGRTAGLDLKTVKETLATREDTGVISKHAVDVPNVSPKPYITGTYPANFEEAPVEPKKPEIEKQSKEEFEQMLSDIDSEATKRIQTGEDPDTIISDIAGKHPDIRKGAVIERLHKLFHGLENLSSAATQPGQIQSTPDANPGPEKPGKVKLTADQKADILELHANGMNAEAIRFKLGIKDTRQINGVILGAKHAERMRLRRDPESAIVPEESEQETLTAQILDLKRTGHSNTEIKEKLGMKNAKLIRATVKAEVKEEIAVEISKDQPLPSKLPLTTIRRILCLDEEKMTPSSISDALEEEFGLVISVSEIMDVVVKNSKGMVEK